MQDRTALTSRKHEPRAVRANVTTTAPATTTSITPVAASATADGTLPRTGSDTASLLALGSALMLAGGPLTGARARPRHDALKHR